MKKGIGLVLFICILGTMIYFSVTTQLKQLADAAILALFGLGLLAVTFILKIATKTP